MRICELREKEVINVCDGERIGFVEDMIFDLCKGCISHIVVPKNCKFMGIFGKEEEYIIDLRCICQIGNDIILVEMPPEKKQNFFFLFHLFLPSDRIVPPLSPFSQKENAFY